MSRTRTVPPSAAYQVLRPASLADACQLARDLGVHQGTQGNWVAEDRAEHEGTQGLSTRDVAELKRLRAENAQLRMGAMF
jgi:transposase-like protein